MEEKMTFERFEMKGCIYRDAAGYLNLTDCEVPQDILPDLQRFHDVKVKIIVEMR